MPVILQRVVDPSTLVARVVWRDETTTRDCMLFGSALSVDSVTSWSIPPVRRAGKHVQIAAWSFMNAWLLAKWAVCTSRLPAMACPVSRRSTSRFAQGSSAWLLLLRYRDGCMPDEQLVRTMRSPCTIRFDHPHGPNLGSRHKFAMATCIKYKPYIWLCGLHWENTVLVVFL